MSIDISRINLQRMHRPDPPFEELLRLAGRHLADLPAIRQQPCGGTLPRLEDLAGPANRSGRLSEAIAILDGLVQRFVSDAPVALFSTVAIAERPP